MFHGSMVCLRDTLQIKTRAKSTMFEWHYGMQEEKSHAKLIRVAIRPSHIYTFKQQKFAFLQLLNF